MKITRVFISPDHAEWDGSTDVGYQNMATYISLAISDWLKQQKLELGKFNRLVFEETKDHRFDLKDFGDGVFCISLEVEFKGLEQFANAEVAHEYFKRKYIEGFRRFDAHFGLDLTPALIAMLDDYFKEGLAYEKEAKSRRIRGLKHQVVKQYKFDAFNLLLRVFDKSGEITKEAILFSCEPDPFIVHYEVHKVEMQDDRIQVLNTGAKVTMEYVIHADNN